MVFHVYTRPPPATGTNRWAIEILGTRAGRHHEGAWVAWTLLVSRGTGRRRTSFRARTVSGMMVHRLEDVAHG